jgi:hypothetical protein
VDRYAEIIGLIKKKISTDAVIKAVRVYLMQRKWEMDLKLLIHKQKKGLSKTEAEYQAIVEGFHRKYITAQHKKDLQKQKEALERFPEKNHSRVTKMPKIEEDLAKKVGSKTVEQEHAEKALQSYQKLQQLQTGLDIVRAEVADSFSLVKSFSELFTAIKSIVTPSFPTS